MATLRDGRHCIALVLDGLSRRAGDPDLSFDIGVSCIDASGELDTVVEVRGNRSTFDELRDMARQVHDIGTGDNRACRLETMDAGLSLLMEHEGALVRVELWVDLVRLNPAMRMLAFKGEPQLGARFLTDAAQLDRFWAELDEDLDRLYS